MEATLTSGLCTLCVNNIKHIKVLLHSLALLRIRIGVMLTPPPSVSRREARRHPEQSFTGHTHTWGDHVTVLTTTRLHVQQLIHP